MKKPSGSQMLFLSRKSLFSLNTRNIQILQLVLNEGILHHLHPFCTSLLDRTPLGATLQEDKWTLQDQKLIFCTYSRFLEKAPKRKPFSICSSAAPLPLTSLGFILSDKRKTRPLSARTEMPVCLRPVWTVFHSTRSRMQNRLVTRNRNRSSVVALSNGKDNKKPPSPGAPAVVPYPNQSLGAAGIWDSGLGSLQNVIRVYKWIISKGGHHHTLTLLGTSVSKRTK
ncbi:uncharacterized protein [Phaenicophaeus curvirostris]|uniref:uncharacterized protein isoform X2 n=1 Tax=Phaenicophaeus curvirostris TaxID=33595 RepID=UPI0037F0F617